MHGKTVLVTGATDGIGTQTALELAQMGATVIVHGRDPARGASAVEVIRQRTGSDRVTFEQADFSSLRQVRALAERIKATHGRLDVLVNNAGVYMTSHALTEDGFEMTFGVNHLAHFLLTHLLLDLLKASAPARVVTVSSTLHQSGRVDFDNLQLEQNFSTRAAYNNSKLFNLMFSNELAARFGPQVLTSNSLHPGVIATKMLVVASGAMSGGHSLAQGAETSHYLATSPDVATVTGEYFISKKIASHSRLADDPALRARLWQISAELCGLA